MTTSKQASAEIIVDPIKTETIELNVLGLSPLICNRLAEKARHELLMPKGRKTTADRAASLKHDPLLEFQASPYTLADEGSPTLLAHMSSAFKGAMMSAALDLPGAKKTQIGRLVLVEGTYVPIFGVPELFMTIVRSADMSRTPDVRTRAILPRWAATLTITFAVPLLNTRSVVNLLAAAGKICGVGDWRPEKGKGSYGQFMLVDQENTEFAEIVAAGGRDAQRAAMQAPMTYDRETEELLAWFDAESATRGNVRSIA